MHEREKWVDISKGIVICLMVLGHSAIPIFLSNWIWSFHMPFFFIISSLFTSWHNSNILKFCIRKAKILLIPFVVYSLINIIIWSLINDDTIIGFSYKILIHGWGGVALWFVPVFYVSLVVTHFVKDRFIVAVGFISFLTAWLLSYFNFELPWTISSIPFSTFLMLSTRRLKKQILNSIKKYKLKDMVIISLILLIASLYVSQKVRLDMASNHILPICPILIGIISGVSFIICISIILSKSTVITKLISPIGRNTYEIMALSQVTIASINTFLNISIILKYLALILVMMAFVCVRKVIEGKLYKQEAI